MNKIQRIVLLVAGASTISLALWKTLTTPDKAPPPASSVSFVQQLPFPVVFGLGALLGVAVGSSILRRRRNAETLTSSDTAAQRLPAEVHTPSSDTSTLTAPVRVSILTDHLKHPILQDPEVLRVLERNNIELNVTAVPDVHAHPSQENYDILWPTNVPPPPTNPTAPIRKCTPLLYSAIGLATWEPIAKVLSAHGVYQHPSSSSHSNLSLLDLNKLVRLLARKTTWDKLGGSLHIGEKSVKVEVSSHIHPSVLGLFLAYASKAVDQPTANQMATLDLSLSDCLLSGANLQNPYLEPFEDYINLGMAHSPMIIAYEHQYYRASNKKRLNSASHYPRFAVINPAILIQHPLLSSSPAGDTFATLLSSASELRSVFINQHGYRMPQMSASQTGMYPLPAIADAPSSAQLQRCSARIQELLSPVPLTVPGDPTEKTPEPPAEA